MKKGDFLDCVAQHCLVYDENTFHAAFVRDLMLALYSVLIQSPYLSSFGIQRLMPIIKERVGHGIRVCMFFQEPKSWETEKTKKFMSDIAELRAIGVHVTTDPRKHEKVAVFDGTVLWDGSLNIMSYNTSLHSDRITRIASPHMAQLAIGHQELMNCLDCIELRKNNVIGPCMYMVEAQTLGPVLRLKREQLGLSQTQLASAAGVSRSLIVRIESGECLPELTTFMVLCEIFCESLTVLPKYTLPHVDHLTMNMPKPQRCA